MPAFVAVSFQIRCAGLQPTVNRDDRLTRFDKTIAHPLAPFARRTQEFVFGHQNYCLMLQERFAQSQYDATEFAGRQALSQNLVHARQIRQRQQQHFGCITADERVHKTLN